VFSRWGIDWVWEEAGCEVWSGGGEREAARFRAFAAEADVGVTTVDFAIAETGTLVLLAGPDRPRATSLLPRVHVALVRLDQVRRRMGETMEEILLRPGGPPSATLFVTGPSRTSDIENDLAIGVHGPAAVIVLLLDPRAGDSR